MLLFDSLQYYFVSPQSRLNDVYFKLCVVIKLDIWCVLPTYISWITQTTITILCKSTTDGHAILRKTNRLVFGVQLENMTSQKTCYLRGMTPMKQMSKEAELQRFRLPFIYIHMSTPTMYFAVVVFTKGANKSTFNSCFVFVKVHPRL